MCRKINYIIYTLSVMYVASSRFARSFARSSTSFAKVGSLALFQSAEIFQTLNKNRNTGYFAALAQQRSLEERKDHVRKIKQNEKLHNKVITQISS